MLTGILRSGLFSCVPWSLLTAYIMPPQYKIKPFFYKRCEKGSLTSFQKYRLFFLSRYEAVLFFEATLLWTILEFFWGILHMHSLLRCSKGSLYTYIREMPFINKYIPLAPMHWPVKEMVEFVTIVTLVFLTWWHVEHLCNHTLGTIKATEFYYLLVTKLNPLVVHFRNAWFCKRA